MSWLSKAYKKTKKGFKKWGWLLAVVPLFVPGLNVAAAGLLGKLGKTGRLINKGIVLYQKTKAYKSVGLFVTGNQKKKAQFEKLFMTSRDELAGN